jgi:hypothetical protein
MSVRLHYPEVFDHTEGFSDFKQGLDWTFRMAEYADKRHIAEGRTQA